MITSSFCPSSPRLALVTIVLSGLLAGLTQAANLDLTKLPPASTQKDVTFAKDIQPLFKASCIQCHSGDRPKAGLRLDSLEHALKGSKDGKVIAPGDSAKSQLVIAIAQLDPHTAMPPKPRRPMGGPRPGAPGQGAANPGNPGHDGPEHSMANTSTNPPAGGPAKPMMPMPKPLTADQVGLVRAWIDQGAK